MALYASIDGPSRRRGTAGNANMPLWFLIRIKQDKAKSIAL